MLDSWFSLVVLSLKLAASPATLSGDPGPHPACPNDMRLVQGEHYDNTAHVCRDASKGNKDTHCYAYEPDITTLEGPVTKVHVCMDRFEAPNRRGAKPMVLQSHRSAKRWCAKQGKRMCHEREWELACEGTEHRPLAYGWQVDRRLCNSARKWKPVNFEAFGRDFASAKKESLRLWQGSRSGRYRNCVSPFGIYDLMGNVEEWVDSRETRKHPGSLMGGFWAKPWTGCRGTNDAHGPTFAFYETGFRCCKDPTP